MRTKIDWVELHAPLFLAGTNLGQKIPSATHKSHITMEYDEEKRHLYVTYNKKSCRIPETSVLSMVESKDLAVRAVTDETHAIRQPVPFNPQAAQVSSPMDHVHAGPGGGLTGQEHVVKKGKGK